MTHADFVHLRVHTSFSLSEGAIKIDELVSLCRAYRMPAVAMADSGNLFGAVQFPAACVAQGVQPILGCVLAISNQNSAGSTKHGSNSDQIVLLAQDETGYRNLVKLVSRSFLGTHDGNDPKVELTELENHAAGLIALTGGPGGAVGRELADGRTNVAEAILLRLAQCFPGRLYAEVMRHGLEIERRTELALLDLAYRHGIPLVATNDVYFADSEMYEAHDVLMCIAEGCTIGREDRRRMTPEHRFKSPAEMRELFADLPEALVNTLAIARRCAYLPDARSPILPKSPRSADRDDAEVLGELARQGLDRRLGQCAAQARNGLSEEVYRERLKYELDIIERMGFSGYFLIVADFIHWARKQGIPVGPGRGSGAGSVVAWALTITDLDPLRFGLLFERFLNPERISMPDFDIDFCQDRRDEVIEYVQGIYGGDRVAQIITFGTLQARAALRDVGRVLEQPYGKVDRICKMVPYNPAHPVSLGEAIASEPQLKDALQDEGVDRMARIAMKLEGLHRHASTHAAGVVIADRPLEDLVPLYRDPRSEMAVTQFSMKDVEKAGLVKFDFLGLKTLTVLDRAIKLLRARGTSIDVAAVPLDDPTTFAMLGKGETVGVFQLESSGMRDVLHSLKPDCFEDIIALVALYRPGPMDNIPRYIACKHGDEKPDYLHPDLTDLLRETFGVIIYQEQVMEIAKRLAGYSLGGADKLRRAMGKKDKKEMDAQREVFVQGAVSRGINRAKAAHIFDLVAKFAGYGFNKSHAAAYALVAYQTAYLKANHPVEFFAASMSLDIGNTDKLYVFRQELDRLGIPLLAPDVNRSEADFTVEGNGTGAIRYALAAIKNVGAQAMASMVGERLTNGEFRTISDFARRVDPHSISKRQLESLARAGAFDCLNANRAQVFAAVAVVLRQAGAAAVSRSSHQTALFGDQELALPEVSDWPTITRLKHEHEAIGFYFSAHPVDAYGNKLDRLGITGAGALTELLAEKGATEVRLAGVVLAKQERRSSRGGRFAFVQMSDPSGQFEVALFAEVLSAYRELLDSGIPLLVAADARLEGDAMRLTARSLSPLDLAEVNIRIDGAEAGQCLRAKLEEAGKGISRVTLLVDVDDGNDAHIMLWDEYGLTPSLCSDIDALPGVKTVEGM